MNHKNHLNYTMDENPIINYDITINVNEVLKNDSRISRSNKPIKYSNKSTVDPKYPFKHWAYSIVLGSMLYGIFGALFLNQFDFITGLVAGLGGSLMVLISSTPALLIGVMGFWMLGKITLQIWIKKMILILFGIALMTAIMDVLHIFGFDIKELWPFFVCYSVAIIWMGIRLNLNV